MIVFLVSFFYIIVGILFININETKYLGWTFLLLGFIYLLFSIKKIQIFFGSFMKLQIEKEKNIKLREREEIRHKRNTVILFALVISGSFTTIEVYKEGLLGLSIFLLLIYFYFLYDRIYLEKYMDYTDELNNLARNLRLSSRG